MIEKLTNWVNNLDPIITLVSFLITIIGFPLSFYFYLKAKVYKRLSFAKHSFRLLSTALSQLDALHITYNEVPVKGLTATNIVVWNSGTQTINKIDVVPKKPITIFCQDENQIYDAYITTGNESTNNFVLKKINLRKYQLNFDYTDKSHGCVLQVLHSGGFININGHIKGGRLVYVENTDRSKKEKILNSRFLGNYLFEIILILTIIILITCLIYVEDTVLRVGLGLYIALGFYFLSTFFKSSKIPINLYKSFKS